MGLVMTANIQYLLGIRRCRSIFLMLQMHGQSHENSITIKNNIQTCTCSQDFTFEDYFRDRHGTQNKIPSPLLSY